MTHHAIDAAEAATNAAIGLLVSWSATYWMLPFWGLEPSAGDALGITMAFFVLSFARAWVLRRVFRGME